MQHLPQPSMADLEEVGLLRPLSRPELSGIKIAAQICRMYGEGEKWAEVIESHGEQIRARYWLLRRPK